MLYKQFTTVLSFFVLSLIFCSFALKKINDFEILLIIFDMFKSLGADKGTCVVIFLFRSYEILFKAGI